MTDQPGIPDAESIPPVARTVAILGAGGDLTERLLLPGLARVVETARGLDITLIGAARTAQSDDEWQTLVRRSLEAAGISEHTVDALTSRARFLQTDASDPVDLAALLAACPSAPVLYVALPPAMGHRVAEALAAIDRPDDLVVAIEKPFGEDLDDARKLNEVLAAVIPADRLWRIDHFLGNATVRGMLGLRFGNRLFEATWSGEHIEKVEIVFDEELGLEGRAAFYDKTGALRDMLQSHLLMVLALIAMERPDAITADDVHGRMAEVLGTTRIWRDDPRSARRARYTEGRVDGRLFPSYVDEADVDGDRGIETLAQLLLQVDTPRWKGVPFVLRSGKAIGSPRAEAAVHFRPASPPGGFRGANVDTGTVLRMSLENGDVDLDLFVVGTRAGTGLHPVRLEARPGEPELDAYAQVLAGLLQNDTLLSVRGDIAEQCWRIVTPVLNAWEAGEVPMEEYPAGSSGPDGW